MGHLLLRKHFVQTLRCDCRDKVAVNTVQDLLVRNHSFFTYYCYFTSGFASVATLTVEETMTVCSAVLTSRVTEEPSSAEVDSGIGSTSHQ